MLLRMIVRRLIGRAVNAGVDAGLKAVKNRTATPPKSTANARRNAPAAPTDLLQEPSAQTSREDADRAERRQRRQARRARRAARENASSSDKQL
ncbi:hypothetical protein [Phaeobacter sp.]|uniref:hypothetical protein n=1 Tax=Phaeobacter sp. TaxID=1902409 RepID=UPI0025DCF863|nr:hypothetical protein [Phaeobacter sp.]